ncbi:MAG: ABC transporter substrate-binding protein, partial [Chloroflexota bacterium]
MNHVRSRLYTLIAMLILASMVFSACAAPAAPSAGDTAGDAADTSMDGGDSDDGAVAREDIVIFDISSGRVGAPEIWNPYIPGHRRDAGMHQLLIEPLFMSHLLTGEIEPWLGESMTPNETLDVWTLKIQEGAKWSDGEAFNADDVVFSVNLVL